MRQTRVLFKGEEAGILTQRNDGSFTFRYHDAWMHDGNKPAISLTLPKSKQEYYSRNLFPFFYNMLPEGSNRDIACQIMRIDTDDHFGLLMLTAKSDTIGAVTISPIINEKMIAEDEQ